MLFDIHGSATYTSYMRIYVLCSIQDVLVPSLPAPVSLSLFDNSVPNTFKIEHQRLYVFLFSSLPAIVVCADWNTPSVSRHLAHDGTRQLFHKIFLKKKTQAVLQKGRIIQEIAYTVRWGPTVAYRRSALWLASSSVCWVVRRGLMDNSHSTIIRSTVASSNSPMR